jgi:hypothetical protein
MGGGREGEREEGRKGGREEGRRERKERKKEKRKSGMLVYNPSHLEGGDWEDHRVRGQPGKKEVHETPHPTLPHLNQ